MKNIWVCHRKNAILTKFQSVTSELQFIAEKSRKKKKTQKLIKNHIKIKMKSPPRVPYLKIVNPPWTTHKSRFEITISKTKWWKATKITVKQPAPSFMNIQTNLCSTQEKISNQKWRLSAIKVLRKIFPESFITILNKKTKPSIVNSDNSLLRPYWPTPSLFSRLNPSCPSSDMLNPVRSIETEDAGSWLKKSKLKFLRSSIPCWKRRILIPNKG